LRRRLRSAERFSDRAISRGLDLVNTPLSSVSASLSLVTRLDQRGPPRFVRLDFLRLLFIVFGNALAGPLFAALRALCIGLSIVSRSGLFV
jgi:hypothetical protein